MTNAGSFNGRTRRSERRNAGSSPAPATAASAALFELPLGCELESRTQNVEVIRPDEEPVLKTGAGSRSLRVRVPRLPPFEAQHGPVAQRRGQLPYKETIGGSSPPRITDTAR